MRKFILLSILLTSVTLITAQQVNFFNGTIQEAKQKSIAEGKPLMVYIGATWCGYCQYTENVIFMRDTAYEFLNENFICVRVDEKAKEAKQLQRTYEAPTFPGYFFFDETGNYVRHYDGFLIAKKLKEEAEKAKKKRKKLF